MPHRFSLSAPPGSVPYHKLQLHFLEGLTHSWGCPRATPDLVLRGHAVLRTESGPSYKKHIQLIEASL